MNFPPVLFCNQNFLNLLTNNYTNQNSSNLISYQNLCKKMIKYENKDAYFQTSVINWIKSLSKIQLIKYCSFKNQWFVDVLHELILISNSNQNIKYKFITPSNSEQENKEPQDTKVLTYINFILEQKEQPRFYDYFNLCNEGLINLSENKTEGEKMKKKFIDNIRYITLSSNSNNNINNNNNNNNSNNSDRRIFHEYNNVVTLSWDYFSDVDKLLHTFSEISQSMCFKYPIEIDHQESKSGKIVNYYNFKLPKWLKETFSLPELLCSFFEQSLLINYQYYLLYGKEISILYYNKFDELLNNTTKLVEFIEKSQEKVEIFQSIKSENIKKKFNENQYIKQIINDKKSIDDDIRSSYIGNYNYKKKLTIKTTIDKALQFLEKLFIKDVKSFVLSLIFFKDSTIFTTEDFVIKIIYDTIIKYWGDKEVEDLLLNSTSNNGNNNSNNKKRKKKKKKRKENKNDDKDKEDKNNFVEEENICNNEKDLDNENNISDQVSKEEDKKEEDKKEEDKKDIQKEDIQKEDIQKEDILKENMQKEEEKKDIQKEDIQKEDDKKDIQKEDIQKGEINEEEDNNDNYHKKKKEKNFFLYPTVKDKKKKNKQNKKKDKNLNSNNNVINNNESSTQMQSENNSNQSNKDNISDDVKIEEEENINKIILSNNNNDNNNNNIINICNDINGDNNEKYKKTKNEFEYISSKQKNKFNIGMKLKNLLKENSNVIIPKNYDTSYNKSKYKNQMSYTYQKEEIEDKTNDKFSINSKDENSNCLTGSNLPRFTSFNFQSKKKGRNYKNKHNNISPYSFITNNIIEFSKEIIDFTMNINKNKEFLQQIREKYIKKIYEIVNIILMDLKVDFLCSFYGSTISGLSIENSDIDILVKIKENKQQINYLKNIMNDLVAQLKIKNINFINNINPILSASVPVIKLECNLCNDETFSHEINTLIKKYDLSYNDITKLYFDITFFEVENEQDKIPSELMIDYIKESLMIYPKIIDIIYIMKKYLLHRKLNKSYQGGISSYSLFLLTLSFVKYFKNNYDLPIGSLLIDYLSYYSNLDFYSTVIQPNKDDNIYSLIEGNSNFQQYKLNIIDPITGLNVSKSTFKIEQIKEAFAEGLNNIISNLYTINNNENMNSINGHKKILDIFLAK